MDELLQKLLEAEILSQETKEELEAALKQQLEEAVEAAKNEAAADVRADLTEQWVTEREALIEAIDKKVDDFLSEEMEELREDIESFRDLEAEYAQRLVEEKQKMAAELDKDLEELVEKLDSFIEIRLNAELEELREDLEVVRQNEFGRKIFEAYYDEYLANYADPDAADLTLKEAEERLQEYQEALAEADARYEKLYRKIKMEEVLSPLSGRQREVMEAILQNVDTEQLDEGYNTFIGRVVRETEETSDKEGQVLSEGDSDDNAIDNGVLLEGNKEEVASESQNTALQERLAHLRELAGIK